MSTLIRRNLKVFFRDRTAVFFSLLSVFIIIGLYVLFLGNVWTKGMSDIKNPRFLMDSWIMAGLLAVTSATTTMGAFGIMIEDKTKKISKDFYSAPVKRSSIAAGYIISAFIIGVIMSIVAFVLAEAYIVSGGGHLLSAVAFLKVLGLILLSSLASTALVGFIVSFFKSQSAFATASTIVGTLIGFITGIYLPVGQLPSTVQTVVKIFPISHAAALFRQVMMETPLNGSFAGVPASAKTDFSELMGVHFRFSDTTISATVSILILVATAVVFYALTYWNLSKKQK